MTQLLDVYESLLVRKKKKKLDGFTQFRKRAKKKNKDARRKLIERVKE